MLQVIKNPPDGGLLEHDCQENLVFKGIYRCRAYGGYELFGFASHKNFPIIDIDQYGRSHCF